MTTGTESLILASDRGVRVLAGTHADQFGRLGDPADFIVSRYLPNGQPVTCRCCLDNELSWAARRSDHK